jgi:competence protein ComEA
MEANKTKDPHPLALRWRAWAPILMRALACGLALSGLAGIGMAAGRAPQLSPASGGAVAAGLGQLSAAAFGSSPSAAFAPEPQAEAAPDVNSPDRPPLAANAGPPELSGGGAASRANAAVPCGRAPRSEPSRRGPEAGAPLSASHGIAADGRVILNRATDADLRRLPGIGAKRARAILELRARLGRFQRVADLLRVKGIGPRLLQRLAAQVVLDAPSEKQD